jgi:CSLREA domain-containing protein
MLFSRFTLVTALLAALVGSAVHVTPVHAASIVVNSNLDVRANNDGKCTLREAIVAANLNTPSGPVVGECAAGSVGMDSISFADSYTITVGNELPYVISPITITGRGAANTIIQAAASPNTVSWRIFQVASSNVSSGNLTLDQLTLRNGRCSQECSAIDDLDFPGAGGAIYNNAVLIVKNSIIRGNTADEGGAIYNNKGTVTVINSTFSDNRADFAGGGIHNGDLAVLSVTNSVFLNNLADYSGGALYNGDDGSLVVVNSTFSGNTAGDRGGGVHNDESPLDLKSSTFVGNSAPYGGALYNGSSLLAVNSTFSGNMADKGGGIYNVGTVGTLKVTNSTLSKNVAWNDGGGIFNSVSSTDSVTLKNSIVAQNSGGNCFGVINNGGSNLDSGATCGWGSNFGSMSNTDPMLGPLANNGGPTQTMKLLAGSPAIDKGNAGFCSAAPVSGVDQRGVMRPLGAACDIGAYEYNTFADVPLNYWALNFIERLYGAGITGGCAVNPLRYCPEGMVTRAQMAVFLERGIHGSSYNPPAVGGSTGFNDVPPTYWAASWIKQLAIEGITDGCGFGNYCPESPVTRAQMAVFLLRSKHGSSYTPPVVGNSTGFSDVPPNYWAAAWIKQLVAEGITSGCGTGTYCPEAPVTRAQMAVFLVRTFNLP